MALDIHSSHGSQSAFRPDIEGLRAIAILLVVLYHAGVTFLSGGYVGVDVFFVLSGYLITGLLYKEIHSTGRLDFVRFYARRARRLLPAAALVIVVTLLAAQFLYSPQELKSLAATAIATALYFSNLRFANSSTDYLADDSTSNALLHTWSLSVEEQFYFFWPVFVLLVLKGFVHGKVKPARLLFAMAALAVVSLAASAWLTQRAQPWAFFSSPTRAWEFAIGGLAYFVPSHWMQARQRLSLVFSWAGLAAILYASITFDHHTTFPGVAALIPVIGTALVLMSFAPGSKNPLAIILNSRLMQWFGSRSYSWYLWHWPVLVLAGAYWREGNLYINLAALGFSLLLASASYRFFESPIRAQPTLSARPVLSLSLAVCLTLACVGYSGWWRHSADLQAHLPEQIKFTEAKKDQPVIYDSDCHLDFFAEDLTTCEFGDLTSETTVVLFGDSHAAQWFPALEILARENHWRLIPFTKSACPAALVDPVNRQLGRLYSECINWRKQVLSKISALDPSIVIVAHSRYVRDEVDASEDAISSQEWEQGMKHTLASIEQSGVASVVMRDTPWPGFNVPDCLARRVKAPWLGLTCEYELEPAIQSIELSLNRKVAAGLGAVSFVDLTDSICSQIKCNSMDPSTGIVLYRDSHHLTTDYVEHIAPDLLKQIGPLIEKYRQMENVSKISTENDAQKDHSSKG